MNDFSYDGDDEVLIDNEILMQCNRRQSPELTNDIEELDFDDRVHYFKTLNVLQGSPMQSLSSSPPRVLSFT